MKKPNPEMLEPLVKAGLDLIPLHRPDDLDEKGRKRGKSPRDKTWTKKSYDGTDALAWMREGRNVGARLRRGELVIDVDPRNFPAGDDVRARLFADFGISLSDHPYQVTGSGGLHVFMSIDPDLKVSETLKAYPGVEFKSVGRQVVVAGSVHPDADEYYVAHDTWLGEFSAFPEAPPKLVEAITRKHVARTSTQSGNVPVERIEKLLDKLDPEDFQDYGKWIELLMSVHHATDGEARQEFIDWSTRDTKYADQEWNIGNHWDSMDPAKEGGVTYRTLFKAVIAAGGRDLLPSKAEADFAGDEIDTQAGQASSEPDTVLAAMNREHFTVLHGGKHLVGTELKHPTLGHDQVRWTPTGAFAEHYNRTFVETVGADGKKTSKAVGRFWLNHPKRRTYDGVHFDPSPDSRNPRIYNLWRGWAYEPVPLGSWSLMKQLLLDVLCGGDKAAYDYVIKWAAFMVQMPHRPAEVALVFKGRKGLGKGTFARALMKLAGGHGKQVSHADHFAGKFNDHLMDCILLFVDEGYWAGDKNAEGSLKRLITEPTLMFEPKGMPIMSGPNLLHIVMASNESWVVPASHDERRFAVLDVDEAAWASLPEGFFDELNAEMDGGGHAAMLHDLLAVELAGWHPRRGVPKTRGLMEQKLQSFRQNPMHFFWHRQLEMGRFFESKDMPVTDDNWADGAVTLTSQHKESLVHWLNEQARRMGKRSEYTKHALAQFLPQVGVDISARDKRGGRAWVVPKLSEARSAFERWAGGPIMWESDGDDEPAPRYERVGAGDDDF